MSVIIPNESSRPDSLICETDCDYQAKQPEELLAPDSNRAAVHVDFRRALNFQHLAVRQFFFHKATVQRFRHTAYSSDESTRFATKKKLRSPHRSAHS